MLLYVDETENEEYFIVTGLLVESREIADKAFDSFKKDIKNMPISKRDKAILYTEFKSTILDRKFQRIKSKMLEEIASMDNSIIYSCYIKKGSYFSQTFKEATYLTLLSKIVSSTEKNISVIFDRFNKHDFEAAVVERISSYPHVQAIMPRDSQKEKGLQFVDNICSVMRLIKSGTDEYGFYQIISKTVKEV